ncbi:hypothetical protein [Cupriavidus sp. D39]|uniref:hypothetical protein n=1 Tax=Cupriavidus sp. D39 TaxID=2997877 RepID=UPI00226FC343|nr:hypothetical protein [Cupriavidus sp. D39]MCY0852992.1 hypothetical protein [Cupriavidus sp. D39]
MSPSFVAIVTMDAMAMTRASRFSSSCIPPLRAVPMNTSVTSTPYVPLISSTSSLYSISRSARVYPGW